MLQPSSIDVSANLKFGATVFLRYDGRICRGVGVKNKGGSWALRAGKIISNGTHS